jgi:hypothetical protein
MAIDNEKDLGKAVKNEQETIEIEGNLKDKVLRIKATGKVAWVVAIGAIAIAIAGTSYPVPEPATQTLTKGVAAIAAPAAVSVLGVGTTISAISIAVAAGGIGVLNSLRNYKIVENTADRLVLRRK